MKFYKIFFFFSLLLVISFTTVNSLVSANVSLGISPAEIVKDNIKPGSAYTKTIVFSQSDPTEEITILAEYDLGEMNDWVSIEQGQTFIIPTGASQYSIDVTITVPENAELKAYAGVIRFMVDADDSSNEGVSVVAGARLDVNLVVTNKDEIDFLVRNVEIGEVSSGGITVMAKIENLGNVYSAPTNAVMDIRNLNEVEIASVETSDIVEITPGAIETIPIRFNPTQDVPIGEYFSDVSIYNDVDLLRKERLVLSIDENYYAEDVTVNANEKDAWVSFIKDNEVSIFLGYVMYLLILLILWFLYLRRLRKSTM